MSHLVFREPLWLWTLLLVPPLVVYRALLLRRFRRAVPFPPAHQVEALAGRGAAFPWIATGLLLAGLSFLALALARPSLKSSRTTVSTEGVAILLCIDVSGSMIAEDFQPNNRIDVARTVVADFVRKRGEDRMGLVTFAAMPFLRCPLTLDHRTLLTLVQDLRAVTRTEIDGTAIGDALVAAGKRLLGAPEKSRVVILLTDGENNRGQFDPLQAADMLAAHHIRVYAVGIGSSGVVPYPVTGESGKKSYQYVRIGFNEEVLKSLAKSTDGVYFNASDGRALERVFEAIDRLERTKTQSAGYVSYADLFLYPIGAALLCLVACALWEMTLGRSLP
jgi:Ca-activated chloride channel family protein